MSSGSTSIEPGTNLRSPRGRHAQFFLNLQRDRTDIIPVSVREAVAHIALRRDAFERQRFDLTVPSAADEPHNPFVQMQKKEAERRAAAKEEREVAIAAKLEQRHRPLTSGGASVSAKLLQQREQEEQQQQQKRIKDQTEEEQKKRGRASPHTPHSSRRPHSSPAAAAAALMSSPLMRLPSDWAAHQKKIRQSHLLGSTHAHSDADEVAATKVITNRATSPTMRDDARNGASSSMLNYDDIPIDDGGDDSDGDGDDLAVVVVVAAGSASSQSTMKPSSSGGVNALPVSSARPPSSATARRSAGAGPRGLHPTSPTAAQNAKKRPATSTVISSSPSSTASPASAPVAPALCIRRAAGADGSPVPSLKEQLAIACEVPSEAPSRKSYRVTNNDIKSNNSEDDHRRASPVLPSTMIRRIHSAGIQRVTLSDSVATSSPSQTASPTAAASSSSTTARPNTASAAVAAAAQGTKSLIKKLSRETAAAAAEQAASANGNYSPWRRSSVVVDLPRAEALSRLSENNNSADAEKQKQQPDPYASSSSALLKKAPLEEEKLRAATAHLIDVTTDLLAKTLASRGTFHSLVNWADSSLEEALGAAENEKSETEPAWVSEHLQGIPELCAVSGPGVSAMSTTLLVLNSIMTCDPAVSVTWGGTWATIRNVLIAGLFGTDAAYRVSQEMLRGMTRFRLSEEQALARALSSVPSLTEFVQSARVRCAMMKKKIDSKDEVIAGLDIALAKRIKTYENKRTRLVWRAWREYAAKSRWQRWAKNQFAAKRSNLALLSTVFNEWRRVSVNMERQEALKQRDNARMEAKHAKLMQHKAVEEAKAELFEEATTARRHLAEERSLRQAQVSALTMETERLLSQRQDLQEALEHFSTEGRLWHNLWQEHRPRHDLFSLPLLSTVLAKSAVALHDAMAPLFARAAHVSLLVAGDSPLIAPQAATVFGLGPLQQTAHNRTFLQIMNQANENNNTNNNNNGSDALPPPLQLPVETQRQLTRTKSALNKFLFDWVNEFIAAIPAQPQAQQQQQPQQQQIRFSRVLVRDSDFTDGAALIIILRHLLECAQIALLVPHYPRSLHDKITAVLARTSRHAISTIATAAASSEGKQRTSASAVVLNLFHVALDVFSVFPLFPALLQNCPFVATHFTPAKILAPEFSEWWQYLLGTLFLMWATLPTSIGFVAQSSASSNSVFMDATDPKVGDVTTVVAPAAASTQQQQQPLQRTATGSDKKANIVSATNSPQSPTSSPLLQLSVTCAFNSESILELLPPAFTGNDSVLGAEAERGGFSAGESLANMSASGSFLQNSLVRSSPTQQSLLAPTATLVFGEGQPHDDSSPMKLTKQQKRELCTLASRGPVPLQCLLGQHHFAHHVPVEKIVAHSAGGAPGDRRNSGSGGAQKRSSSFKTFLTPRSSAANVFESSGANSGSSRLLSPAASSANVFAGVGGSKKGGGGGGSFGGGGNMARSGSNASAAGFTAVSRRVSSIGGGRKSNSGLDKESSFNGANNNFMESPIGSPSSRPHQQPSSGTTARRTTASSSSGAAGGGGSSSGSPRAGSHERTVSSPSRRHLSPRDRVIIASTATSGGTAVSPSKDSGDGVSLTHGTLDTHLSAMQAVIEGQQAQWRSVLERWQSQLKWESLFANGNSVAKQLLKATRTDAKAVTAVNNNINNNNAADAKAKLPLGSPKATSHLSAVVANDNAEDDEEIEGQTSASQQIRGPLRFYSTTETTPQPPSSSAKQAQPQKQIRQQRKASSAGGAENTKFAQFCNPPPLEAVSERRRCWEQTIRQRAWFAAARLVATAIAEFHILEWQPQQNCFRSMPTPVYVHTTTSSGDGEESIRSGSRSRQQRLSSARGRRMSARSTGNASISEPANFNLDGPTAPSSPAVSMNMHPSNQQQEQQQMMMTSLSCSLFGSGATASSVFGSETIPDALVPVPSAAATAARAENVLCSLFTAGEGSGGGDGSSDPSSSAVQQQQRQQQHQQQESSTNRTGQQQPSAPNSSPRNIGSAAPTRRDQRVSTVNSLLFNASIMNEISRK